MDNFRNSADDINGWETVSEPVMKTTDSTEADNCTEDNNSEVTERKKHCFTAPVLTFQLIICLLVLTFAFVSKSFFGNLFADIKEVYDKEISASMFFSGDFSGIDYSNFFGASEDEF